jgi:hypothetical protein
MRVEPSHGLVGLISPDGRPRAAPRTTAPAGMRSGTSAGNPDVAVEVGDHALGEDEEVESHESRVHETGEGGVGQAHSQPLDATPPGQDPDERDEGDERAVVDTESYRRTTVRLSHSF